MDGITGITDSGYSIAGDLYSLMGFFGMWLSIILIAALYLCPMVIACRRRHLRRFLISTVNILLGWTLIMWVITLLWALGDNTEWAAKRRARRLARAGSVGTSGAGSKLSRA